MAYAICFYFYAWMSFSAVETDRHAQVNNLSSISFFTARRVYATYMHGVVCSMAL